MRFVKTSLIRHTIYEQKGGYLLVPVLIMLILTVLAVALPHMEANFDVVASWAKHTSWLVPSDPAMAQLLLAAVAGSCITILSVVYSVLLIALTFASMQFSPRILNIFLKDRVSQVTLGLFIGTFSYCLNLLPSVTSGHHVAVPLSLTLALVLATACLFDLIFFIHHIALAIQANYIVDRISKETEAVLRSQFGPTLTDLPKEEEALIEPTKGIAVSSLKTGYVQWIDQNRIVKLAVKADASIFVHRGVGQFIPTGVPCITIEPASAATLAFKNACLSCFHLGPLRSTENDVQFGMLQMVDIALKAISPAVNDPSTAIACIDHLSGILLLATTLEPPTMRVFDENGVVRLMRRQPSFARLLEIAYNQISPYGKGDMAVSLRLMRALYDISGVTNYEPYLLAIRKQAQRHARACSQYFPEEDCKELLDRLKVIETREASGPGQEPVAQAEGSSDSDELSMEAG
jgi:uncharacterized membrane protein